MTGQSYILGCTVNLQNKTLLGITQIKPFNETSNKGACYFTNDSLFTSYDEINWYPSGSKNDWYSLSHLERLLLFFVKNATFKQLGNEMINNSECFVIRVFPNIDDSELRQVGFDYLLPFRYEKSGDDFLYTYNTDVRYWIEKDTYLMKKASVMAIYDLQYSYMPYHSTERIRRHFVWNYTTEILFTKYNNVTEIESPWETFEKTASDALSNLNYSNVLFGFGFNPPRNWTISDSIGLIGYAKTSLPGNNRPPTFGFDHIPIFNLSFTIRPPSHSNALNMSDEIKNKLDAINESKNQSYYENYTLVSHTNRTINGMNAHEFVVTYTIDNKTLKTKEIVVEKEGRIFTIKINGYADIFNEKESEVEQSIDSSLMIIVPYFEIFF